MAFFIPELAQYVRISNMQNEECGKWLDESVMYSKAMLQTLIKFENGLNTVLFRSTFAR